MSVLVKICGVTSVEDAWWAVRCGADFIGLNFFPESPRYVAMKTAGEILAVLPSQVRSVGVFVNAERSYVESLVTKLQLDAVQFHGDEDLRDLQGWSCTTIKALRISPDDPFPAWQDYPVDCILLDTFKKGRYGGTGEIFPWERVAAIPLELRRRLILAGGLTPENVRNAVHTVRPWAVDVASGVESSPGKKDPEKVRAFITNAKTA
ncbi:MAG: phosphoribosylanthranilate isomerase [Candidatus Binatia bacterium]